MCFYIILNEKGANKVADVATSVVQNAILDHMGSQCKALEHIRTGRWPLGGGEWLFLCIKLNEEGAEKVADLRTSVAQDAILDHMGSDLRCQNEVMTTRNC